MNTLSMTFLLMTLFLGGTGIGWGISYWMRQRQQQHSSRELNQLRQAYEQSRKEIATLTGAYRQVHMQKNSLSRLLKTSFDHHDFLKIRKQLEEARKQLDHAEAELQRREQYIVRLADLARGLKKQLRQQQTLLPISAAPRSSILYFPVASNQRYDDLQQIEGIDAEVARKLQQMGITRFRQLAESTPIQQANIQTLLGSHDYLPVNTWVKAAQALLTSETAGNTLTHNVLHDLPDLPRQQLG